MARRDRDTVIIESVQGGDFSIVVDRATQYEITSDLFAPSTARFELGDSGTWSALREALAIGSRWVVSINGVRRITGRALTRNLAVTADAGATVQLTIRTLLADAMFESVDPKIGVKNTTLKDIVLAAFKQLGLTEADFVFSPETARDAITGRPRGGGTPPPDLSTLTEEEARPHPPESIFAFVDRHLSRFHLMIWDGADGKLIVGAPDDTQDPLYLMTARRGAAAQTNNILSAQKTEDFEEVPASLWVYGLGGSRDQSKARVKFVEYDSILSAVDPPLGRKAIIIDESLKTQAQAEARARREMMQRSLQKDTWVIETDGLTYWTGTERVQYAVDTVADLRVDVAGGASGPYLLYQLTQTGDADNGHTTQFSAVGRGVLRL